jgi:N-acetylglutamate synthase-like GNAT family acetyltransferase
MSATTDIQFREFAPGDEAAFRKLNEEWITRFFSLEPKDEYSLQHPREAILEVGGRIFFASRDGELVGCCALMVRGPDEFEVVKMAVTESCQGSGIGRRLLQHTIEAADAAGVKRLYLETNRRLANAIHLYEALGFRHLTAEEIVPSPYARADVYMERRRGY